MDDKQRDKLIIEILNQMLIVQAQIAALDQDGQHRRAECAKVLYGLDVTDPAAVQRAILAVITLLS